MFWYSAWSIIHHYGLITSCGTGNSFFPQQYCNGKGGNTVTVDGAKMECLGDQKRPMPGGQDMREKDILSALKLTSFTNSQFTLVTYKCGKKSTIRR
jgi:hypothetical protein